MGETFLSKRKSIRILSYNAQLGIKGYPHLEVLLATPVDLLCIQRFPEAWRTNLTEPHAYQPGFPGCPFGCLTVHRKGIPGRQGNTSSFDYGSDRSQATAYIETELAGLTVVNTLPPYGSPEQGIPPSHMVNHLDVIFARTEPCLVVGDMHGEPGPFADLPVKWNGFVNHSRLANFNNPYGGAMNLTKFLSNCGGHLLKETIVVPDDTPRRRNPVLFEWALN